MGNIYNSFFSDIDAMFAFLILLRTGGLLALSICFIQSGLDKIFDYKANKAWLTGHFEKSPLKGTIGLILPVLTLLETSAGFLSLSGIFAFFLSGNPTIARIGIGLCMLSLICLFAGQRVAKEYPGAAVLINYLLLTLLVGILWLV